MISNLIENKESKCYQGKVFRAGIFNPKLINELKICKTMIKFTFWPFTKNFDVDLKFFKDSNYKNVIIELQGKKNNVDLHLEVLFLPFTKFEVINVRKDFIFGKEVYFVDLDDVTEKNPVDSMGKISDSEYQIFN